MHSLLPLVCLKEHDPGDSPLSGQRCPFPLSSQRYDPGPSPLCVSNQRGDPGSSSPYGAHQRRVKFQLQSRQYVIPVCIGGALVSASSCFTTESSSPSVCMPSQRYTESSTNSSGACSSSSSPYFSSEPGPSPLCLAN